MKRDLKWRINFAIYCVKIVRVLSVMKQKSAQNAVDCKGSAKMKKKERKKNQPNTQQFIRQT